MVNVFVKTYISANLTVFFAVSPVIFLKMFFLIFSGHTICAAYLGFHTLLYFEHQVFLALDNVFPYCKKDTQRNQNKVINRRNVIFCFSHLNVFLSFKCQGMLLRLSMWYTKVSAKSLAVFLPTHIYKYIFYKLKKSEYTFAFYCWRTERLNFEGCYIQDCNRGIDDWEVTLFEKCEMCKQLKERRFSNTNKTVYPFQPF